jgi:hypothetical protein
MGILINKMAASIQESLELEPPCVKESYHFGVSDPAE